MTKKYKFNDHPEKQDDEIWLQNFLSQCLIDKTYVNPFIDSIKKFVGVNYLDKNKSVDDFIEYINHGIEKGFIDKKFSLLFKHGFKTLRVVNSAYNINGKSIIAEDENGKSINYNSLFVK